MTVWQTTKRIFSWLTSNAILWGLALAGTLLKANWAFNLLAFAAWFLTFSYAVIWGVVSHDNAQLKNNSNHKLSEITEKIMSKGRVIPAFVDVTLDVIFIGLLVAFGHWFYGILFLIQVYLYQGMFYQIKEIKAASEADKMAP